MDCSTCKKESIDVISVAAHEYAMNREDKKHRRLVIALIIALVLMFLGPIIVHFGWLYTWNQYDFVSEESTIVQDGRGINLIGDENEVIQHNEPDGTSAP